MRLAAAMLALVWAGPALAADKPKEPPGVVQMSPEQQRTVGLRTSAAERVPISEPLRLPGTVGFDPGHMAMLRPLGEARVVRLLVQPGDTVAAGQAVAELEMPMLVQLQQELATARAAMREADAGVAVAAAALNRAVILSRDGSMARAEADRRRLLLVQATAQQQSNRTKVATLELQIARLNPMEGSGLAAMRSPIDGTVVASGITPGEAITSATDAMTVADLHVVQVMAQIPESDATKVGVSDPVKVTIAGDAQRQWEGRVATLGAQLDLQARALPARIRIENPDRTLRAGMYVDVVVTRMLGREAVVVPASSVQLVADKRVVFTPEGGSRFKAHEVQVGVQRQDRVEIARGVKAGEDVVTQGSFELKALLQQSMLDGS